VAYPKFFPQARANLAIVPFDNVPVASSELIRLGSVPPRRIRYESNDIFTADTFELELDETLFPLDLRDVRAVAVDLHLGDAGSLSALIDTVSDKNRLILGQTDKLAKRIETDTASTVTFTGRDYWGLFLDEKWQGRSVTLGRALSEIVGEVKDSIPAVERMDVVAVDGFDPVVPSGRGRKRKKFTAQPDKSVGEVLVNLALKVGAIITVDRDRIQIQPPRNILSDNARESTPLFVEGRNLKSLSTERMLGKPDVPNVLAQSIDPASGALVEGRFPLNFKETARAARVKERAKKSVNVEFRRFTIRHPAPTVTAMNEIAKQIYDFHAREQVSISFTTNDLVVAPNPLPARIDERLRVEDSRDLVATTQLRNGSAIRIRIDPDVRNVLEKAVSEADKERELRLAGYKAQVAAILAKGYRLFDELLFVSKASHEYSTDSGYQLGVEAVNFIEVGP